MKVKGRYAPSPTGAIHFGNARTALLAWLSVQQQGGVFVWRLEDLDGPRVVPGAAEAAASDIRWLGIDWDEGPLIGGAFDPYVQSERNEIYEQALRHLLNNNRLFPCRYSRKDLHELSSAPHGVAAFSPYPASLRPKSLASDWYDVLRQQDVPDANVRFLVDAHPVFFKDRLQGAVSENVAEAVGDFVVKRKDGMYAYQLAVVVDDMAMQITEVVRGMDLLDSTARQIQLIEALGGTVPAYVHVPLVCNEKGEKLSKRDNGLTIASLRSLGIHPEQLIGYMAYSLNLIEKPRTLSLKDMLEVFDWDRISKNDWILPDNLPQFLIRL